jgi:hypothetical protein
MERNIATFPTDDNGDVLWVAHQHGILIGEEYVVQYALIFPEQNDALKFGLFMLRLGYWVKVNELEDKPGYAAEVLLKMILDITHNDITGAENWLADQSASLNGKNDGWEIQDKVEEATSFEFSPFASS